MRQFPSLTLNYITTAANTKIGGRRNAFLIPYSLMHHYRVKIGNLRRNGRIVSCNKKPLTCLTVFLFCVEKFLWVQFLWPPSSHCVYSRCYSWMRSEDSRKSSKQCCSLIIGPPPQNPPAHGYEIVTHSDFSISLHQISYASELL
jgi:hypothetical protein